MSKIITKYTYSTDGSKYVDFEKLYNSVSSGIIRKSIGCGGTTAATKRKGGKINIICEPLIRIGKDKLSLSMDSEIHVIDLGGGIWNNGNSNKLIEFYNEYKSKPDKVRRSNAYTIFVCYHSLSKLVEDLRRNGLLNKDSVRFVFDEYHKITELDRQGYKVSRLVRELSLKYDSIVMSGSEISDSIIKDIFKTEYIFKLKDQIKPTLNAIDVTSKSSSLLSIARYLNSGITGSISMYIFSVRDGINIIRYLKNLGSHKDIKFFISPERVDSVYESYPDMRDFVYSIDKYLSTSFSENSLILYNSCADIGVDFNYPFKHIFIGSVHTTDSIFSSGELMQIAGRHRNSKRDIINVFLSSNISMGIKRLPQAPKVEIAKLESYVKSMNILRNSVKDGITKSKIEISEEYTEFINEVNGEYRINYEAIKSANETMDRINKLRYSVDELLSEYSDSGEFNKVTKFEFNKSKFSKDESNIQVKYPELIPTKSEWIKGKHELTENVKFVSVKDRSINKSWIVFLKSQFPSLIKVYDGITVTHKLIKNFILINELRKSDIKDSMYSRIKTDLEMYLSNEPSTWLSKT